MWAVGCVLFFLLSGQVGNSCCVRGLRASPHTPSSAPHQLPRAFSLARQAYVGICGFGVRRRPLPPLLAASASRVGVGVDACARCIGSPVAPVACTSLPMYLMSSGPYAHALGLVPLPLPTTTTNTDSLPCKEPARCADQGQGRAVGVPREALGAGEAHTRTHSRTQADSATASGARGCLHLKEGGGSG